MLNGRPRPSKIKPASPPLTFSRTILPLPEPILNSRDGRTVIVASSLPANGRTSKSP